MLIPPSGFRPTMSNISHSDKLMLDIISEQVINAISEMPSGVKDPFYEYLMNEDWSDYQLEVIATYILRYPTYQLMDVKKVFDQYEPNEVAYMLKVITERMKDDD